MLDFQPVSMGLKTLVESYTFKYGGFCQHSFCRYAVMKRAAFRKEYLSR